MKKLQNPFQGVGDVDWHVFLTGKQPPYAKSDHHAPEPDSNFTPPKFNGWNLKMMVSKRSFLF